jgi:hypothetical protein
MESGSLEDMGDILEGMDITVTMFIMGDTTESNIADY